MKKIIKDFNLQTGEETITEREETNAEKKIRQEYEEEIVSKLKESQDKAIAKEVILKKLGITAEEAVLFFS